MRAGEFTGSIQQRKSSN